VSDRERKGEREMEGGRKSKQDRASRGRVCGGEGGRWRRERERELVRS
jgi:hypothetical protein